MSDELGSAAVLIVDRGHVVDSWGEISEPMKSYSVRKSLVSLLFGTPLVGGLIDLTDTLEELGIEDEPPLRETERQATVAQVLSSTSGVYHPAAKEPRSLTSRPERGSDEPGTRWWYNNWSFNLALFIWESATSRDLSSAFISDIATPLQLEDLRPNDIFTSYEPNKSEFPAYEFLISARDLARIGVLVENEGAWGAQRIVSSDWIDRSTSEIWSFDDDSGYGYMWWVNPGRGRFFTAKEDVGRLGTLDHIAAVGSYGQMVLIIPSLDIVIIHRGYPNERGVSDSDVFRLIEKILAAQTSKRKTNPLLVDAKFPSPKRDLSADPETTLKSPTREEMDDVVGTYKFGRNGSLKVYIWRDMLFTTGPRPNDGHLQLFRKSDGSYTSRDLPVRIHFESDATGVKRTMTLEAGGQKIVATRQP